MGFLPQFTKVSPITLLLFALGMFAIAPCYSVEVTNDEPTWKELDTNSFPEAKHLRAILKKPDEKNDLARVELILDKMIDPSINIDTNLKKIDVMVAQIWAMLADKANPTDAEKMNALRQYIYDAGAWNNGQIFSYDLNDPLGTKIENKLLPHYLSTRKGNCVSMPLLIIFLGQRLGLDITVSTAPSHLFAKYTDHQSGMVYNVEATSGGHPARDEWMRQQNPITDLALKNGLYMQRLTKKESIAVMAETLADSFAARNEFKKAILISDIILEYYEKNPHSMVKEGFCFYSLYKKEFTDKYPSVSSIPREQIGYFQYLSHEKDYWYDRAASLGWRPPTAEFEKSYLSRLEQTKSALQ